MTTQVAVVFALFNPDSYRCKMLAFVAQRLRMQSKPVHICVSVLGGALDDECLQLMDQVVEVSGSPEAFQKDALWNKAVHMLPASIQTIIFLDADIFPIKSDWVERVCGKLTQLDYIQGFSVLIHLNKPVTKKLLQSPTQEVVENDLVDMKTLKINDREQHTADVPVAFASYMFGRVLDANIGSAGGCKAMGRGLFEKMGGFPYEEIFGGMNDVLLKYRLSLSDNCSDYLFTPAFIERQNRFRFGPVRCGFVPGHLYHLYHKEGAGRQYGERALIGKDLNYNPDADIFVNATGGIEFTVAGKRLESHLRKITEDNLRPDPAM